MNKRFMVEQLSARIRESAQNAMRERAAAAIEARDGASPDEKRADGRVALEFSNLARAQGRRADNALDDLALLDGFLPPSLPPRAPVAMGAIVEVEDGEEGRTIFLTTHNLTEADELCDLIGVFRTRLLKLDTPVNLRTALFGKGARVQVAGDAVPWLATTQALPFVKRAEAIDSKLTVHLDDPDTQNPLLVQALVTAGAQVRYVMPLDASLEDVYLELVESGESNER